MASSRLDSQKSPTIRQHSVRVVKFGGSLLQDPQSCERFKEWHQQQPVALTLMLVGGGVAVDQLRLWDARYSLASHWLHFAAIDSMAANVRLLAEVLSNWSLCRLPAVLNPNEIPAALESFVVNCEKFDCHQILIDPTNWLAHEPDLPRDWSVTSDSIAAHLASILGARELVLLKSSLPRGYSGAEDLGRTNLVQSSCVDRAFAQFSESIETLRLVNLSDPSQPEIRYGPVTQREIRR